MEAISLNETVQGYQTKHSFAVNFEAETTQGALLITFSDDVTSVEASLAENFFSSLAVFPTQTASSWTVQYQMSLVVTQEVKEEMASLEHHFL